VLQVLRATAPCATRRWSGRWEPGGAALLAGASVPTGGRRAASIWTRWWPRRCAWWRPLGELPDGLAWTGPCRRHPGHAVPALCTRAFRFGAAALAVRAEARRWPWPVWGPTPAPMPPPAGPARPSCALAERSLSRAWRGCCAVSRPALSQPDGGGRTVRTGPAHPDASPGCRRSSFQALLDEARQACALAAPHPPAGGGSGGAAGLADTSNFSRTVRRWFGCTPGAAPATSAARARRAILPFVITNSTEPGKAARVMTPRTRSIFFEEV
jgi:hypothetical protein